MPQAAQTLRVAHTLVSAAPAHRVDLLGRYGGGQHRHPVLAIAEADDAAHGRRPVTCGHNIVGRASNFRSSWSSTRCRISDSPVISVPSSQRTFLYRLRRSQSGGFAVRRALMSSALITGQDPGTRARYGKPYQISVPSRGYLKHTSQ